MPKIIAVCIWNRVGFWAQIIISWFSHIYMSIEHPQVIWETTLYYGTLLHTAEGTMHPCIHASMASSHWISYTTHHFDKQKQPTTFQNFFRGWCQLHLISDLRPPISIRTEEHSKYRLLKKSFEFSGIFFVRSYNHRCSILSYLLKIWCVVMVMMQIITWPLGWCGEKEFRWFTLLSQVK